MSEKIAAYLGTVLIVGPLCSVCILGPAVVGSFVAGGFGWLGGVSLVQIAAFGVVGALAALAVATSMRRRRSGPAEAAPGRPR